MAAFLDKAVAITIPFCATNTNEYGVLRIASVTTHTVTPLPDDWSGCAVAFRCFTNNVTIALSPDANAEVESAVSATNTGASTKAGMTVVAGTLYAAVLPTWGTRHAMNLVHEAAANTTTFEIWKMQLPNID